MEHEGTTREDLSIAQAVHNAGGTVICQVKRIAKRGSIHPQMVKIPGFLIDYVVLEPGPDADLRHRLRSQPQRGDANSGRPPCGPTLLPSGA